MVAVRRRAHRRLIRPAPLLVLMIGAGSLLYILTNTRDVELDLLLVASAVAFVLVGALILNRTDGNRVGWVLAAIGLALFLSGVSAVLADRGAVVAGAIGGAIWLSWFVLVGFLMFWFPTGRPLTPRWRWLAWWGLTVGVMSLSYVVSAQLCLEDQGEGCEVWIDNPIGISFVPNPEYGDFSGIGFGALLGFVLLAGVSLVVRFVRSRGIERLQLKWFAFAVGSIIVATVAQETVGGLFPGATVVLDLLWSLSIVALPITIGISVLRYRLYEIDRIVSRTVTYLLVLGLLAAMYGGCFLLLTQLFPSDNDLVVAATTLGVAALFTPVRNGIRRAVDRRFNRSRFNTEKVMDEFSGSLQGNVDSAGLIDGWLGVVSETMQPATVAVWIRPTGR
ncbi:MAG: hypothetical protein ACRDX9_02270 [Acidimicrobiia bacterium]